MTTGRPQEYQNAAGAPVVAAVACRECNAHQGLPCVIKGQNLDSGKTAPRLHTKRVRDFHDLSTPPVDAHDDAPEPPSADDRIIVGDCLAVMAEMPDASVDLVITSPPYNALRTPGGGWWDESGKYFRRRSDRPGSDSPLYDSHDDCMPVDEYIQWQRDCVAEMLRVLTEDGALFYNHRRRVQDDVMEEHARDILEIAPAFGFQVRQIITWARSGGFNHNPGYLLPSQEQIYLLARPGRFRHAALGKIPDVMDVHQVASPRGVSLPPQFPVEIPRRLLAAIRPDSGLGNGRHGIVLDPFGGSGTVAEAAVLEGWDFAHVDISADYCAHARERVAKAVPEASQDGSQPEGSQSFATDGSQPEGSQSFATDGSQPEGSQSFATDGSQDGSQTWDEVTPRWETLDKQVYDKIAAIQAGHSLQAVPLDQKAMAEELGCSARSLSTAIAKLKSAGILSIRYQRGPSLYSVSSEIPRWPVRVAGGLGSHVDASQPMVRNGSQSFATEASQIDPPVNVNVPYRSGESINNDSTGEKTERNGTSAGDGSQSFATDGSQAEASQSWTDDLEYRYDVVKRTPEGIILSDLEGEIARAKQDRWRCPFHPDRRPRWSDYPGADGLPMLHCTAAIHWDGRKVAVYCTASETNCPEGAQEIADG